MIKNLPVLIIVLAFCACKKSAAPPTGSANFMTADINDTSQTFNTVVLAKNVPVSSGYLLAIACASTNTSAADVLSVSIDGMKPITTGTFTANFSGTPDFLPSMAFQHGDTTAYQEDVSGSHPITVTITSLTGTNVQGTFNGTLTLANGSGAFVKKVTNGKFNIDFR